MQGDDSLFRSEAGCWRWRMLAGFLILAVVGLRVSYLLFNCPLDLAADEAHYWDWSRHLDWSYYSKGPLVAYLIRASCTLFGDDTLLAVRLPAVICGGLLLLSLYVLTLQIYDSERLAVAVVALAMTLPAVAAGSFLMTIDAPYTCCWGWALVLGHRAVFRGSRWAWPAAGLVVGLGILAKYTMILWVPSLALFMLATPGYRQLLFRRGFWIMTATAALCCLPILLWNMQHDWVSWRHVSGQAGLRDSAGIRWFGPLTYLRDQFGMLLGFWFVAWLSAMIAHRPWKTGVRGQGSGVRSQESAANHSPFADCPLPTAHISLLWWMSAPMFGVFLLFSLKTAEEPNWPVTAYISGLVLTVAWIARQLQAPWPWWRRLTATCLATACVLGLMGIGFLHQSAWVQPVLLRISGEATAENPLPLRRFDPTCRLRGWRTLAAAVDRLRDELRNENPVIAADKWTLPGELGYYCKSHPTVYSFGPALGDRFSQYDFWHPNPVWDTDAFTDRRPFIFVGEVTGALRDAFEQIEEPRHVVHPEHGQPIAHWHITVCRGFRGFPNAPGWLQGKRF